MDARWKCPRLGRNCLNYLEWQRSPYGQRSPYSSCSVWLSVSFSTSRWKTTEKYLGDVFRDNPRQFIKNFWRRKLFLPFSRVAIFLFFCFCWFSIVFTNVRDPLRIILVAFRNLSSTFYYKCRVYHFLFFFLLYLSAESVQHCQSHLHKIFINLKA